MSPSRRFVPGAGRVIPAALIACPLLSSPVYAAELGPDGSAGILLEEVLVTATKKSYLEDMQKVPIAISAFTAEMMQAVRIENISDVGYWVPNALLEPDPTAPNSTNFFIRGQGTASSVPSDDPAVGVFVDGVVLGISSGANLNTWDYEAVEVLRGPQGTLFGRNVTGGAVVLRTERAEFDFSSDLKLTAGNDNRFDGIFRINGPLVKNRLAGKLSLFYSTLDGHFRNANTAPVDGPIFGKSVSARKEFGEYETRSARGSLRWTPTDPMVIDFIAEYSKTDGDSGNAIKGVTNILNNQGLPDPDDNRQVKLTQNGINELEYSSLTIDFNHATSHGAWAWISGYRKVDQYTLLDLDGSSADIVNFSLAPDQRQLSSELRWAGNPFGNDSFDITAGLYYFNQVIEYREGRDIFGEEEGLGGDVDHYTGAAFGQLGWHITDALTLNFGLRYTNETKAVDMAQGRDLCDPVSGDCNFNFDDSTTWDNVSGNLSLQWFVVDSTQLYASYNRGFRSGGYNIRSSDPDEFPGYGEETVDAFEVGVKSDVTRKLRLNAAVFYNMYDDLQRTLVLPDNSQVTRNAAEATITGVELEGTWFVTANFSISGNYGYLDGRYDDLSQAMLQSFNATRLAAGLQPYSDPGDFELNRLAKHSGSLQGNWDVYFRNASLLTLRLLGSYMGERPLNDANTLIADSYTAIDANASFTSPNQHWQVMLWGKNLTDQTIEIGGTQTAIGSQVVILPGPRYGVDLVYRF